MFCGVVIMMIGVAIVKAAPEHGPLHYFADLFGYAVHGLGLTPFAKVAETFLAER